MTIVLDTKMDFVIRLKPNLFVFRTKRGEWCKQTLQNRRVSYGSLDSLLGKNVKMQKPLELLGLLYA